MEGSDFDEVAFFRAIAESGARALLIGRRALIALGIPVLTSDYDFWIHIDDIAAFNRAAAPFDLWPNHSPEEARKRGRYVLENDERVDVLVARGMPTVIGERLLFDDAWQRRQLVPYASDITITLPSLDDMIRTKQFASRPKDAEDIRRLLGLRGEKP